MRLEDLDIVERNELRAYSFPWTRGVFEDCLKEGQECRIAEFAGEVVGHGVVTFGAGEAHLLNVCIRRESQSNGFGRDLVLHMLERSHNLGASVLFLEVRPSNHIAGNLYETLGFNEIGLRRNYYPADSGHEDARVLVLDLSKFFSA
jgi:ribosomal-protein-alanine N-acetyltransferase